MSKSKDEGTGRCWAVVRRRGSLIRAKHRCAGVRDALTLTTGWQANEGVTDDALLTGGRMLTWSDLRQKRRFVGLVAECLPNEEVLLFHTRDEIRAYRERLHRIGRLRDGLVAKLAGSHQSRKTREPDAVLTRRATLQRKRERVG